MRSSVIALSGRVEWTGRSFTRTRGVRRATDPKVKGEADNTTLDIIVSKEHCETQTKQCACVEQCYRAKSNKTYLQD